jgi:hypothetical protein
MSLTSCVRSPWMRGLLLALLAGLLLFIALPGTGSATRTRSANKSATKTVGALRESATPTHQTLSKKSFGELDCNGYSPSQESVRLTMNCTDVRGDNAVSNSNTWDGRFYDNGHYIGHDEPDIDFLSSQPGSGNNVTWTETLGTDPGQVPTDATPGKDVSHWFELTPAPWLSMALCDPNSYPQTPCTPKDNANAPRTLGVNCGPGCYPGGGSAFMEMQFYPPGQPPWVDSVSCDDSHWCAALTIDSLECTQNFAQCNPKCEEPVNFAFIQRNGIPAGPPSPQDANIQSATPNNETLLMNPGDNVTVHMWDAAVPGEPGEHAFKVVIDDLTTGQTGSMQASAANGFMTSSIIDCSGTPFNFEPEYATAARNNIVPWGADQADISTEFETGHWEACTSLQNPFTFPTSNVGFPGATDTAYDTCLGPYESTTEPDDSTPEVGDALCYPQGDTHGSLNSAADTMTGCLANYYQNGDLDFDGSPYWPEWPTSTTAHVHPGSFVESSPTSNGNQYSQFFFQTDLALSESSCPGNTIGGSGTGTCAVPPTNAPGHFYPYWTTMTTGSACNWEFGNVSTAPSGSTANDYGKDAQYGTVGTATYGYPQFVSSIQTNTCN